MLTPRDSDSMRLSVSWTGLSGWTEPGFSYPAANPMRGCEPLPVAGRTGSPQLSAETIPLRYGPQPLAPCRIIRRTHAGSTSKNFFIRVLPRSSLSLEADRSLCYNSRCWLTASKTTRKLRETWAFVVSAPNAVEGFQPSPITITPPQGTLEPRPPRYLAFFWHGGSPPNSSRLFDCYFWLAELAVDAVVQVDAPSKERFGGSEIGGHFA